MKLMLCCLMLAMLLPVGQSKTEGTQPFRIINIPKGENGYSNFESIVFKSQKELDAFIKEVSVQPGWNQKQVFLEGLIDANVDFSKEALVLFRHTEGSGSVKVTFETPVLKDKNLSCEIVGRPIPPGYGAIDLAAYYCMAVVVTKAQVSQVELQATRGGFKAERLAPIVFSVVPKL